MCVGGEGGEREREEKNLHIAFIDPFITVTLISVSFQINHDFSSLAEVPGSQANENI